jgi:hypothetical protein
MRFASHSFESPQLGQEAGLSSSITSFLTATFLTGFTFFLTLRRIALSERT